MKLILKQNVAGLGYKDDIVEVKDGYGRNYLIPQGLGIIATNSSIKELEENQRQRAHKLAKIKAEAETSAAALEGVKLTITVKATDNGVVFGSVNASHIADALAKLGHEIDRKIIFLKEPVKNLGSYVATVRFHKEVAADIEFDVVAEAEE